ncbi:MAG: creatininase family protein [Beijerinckiaceae bacterium]
MPASPHWSHSTSPDFSAVTDKTIAVLPVAAVEQHGPHLPLGTDAMIMEGYLARVMPLLPDDLDVRFLPLQAVGTSNEHVAFPGTLSLQPDTFMRVIADLGESIARAGCRRLVMLNSHGGNSSVLDIAARELRLRHGMLVVTASWQRFGYPPGLFTAEELEHGIHGGDIETSLMLTFRPELVRRDHIADFPPASLAMAREHTWLRAGRPAGFGWLAQDLSESGAMGNASLASAEKGEACAVHGAAAFVELLQDVLRFELAKPGSAPLSR